VTHGSREGQPHDQLKLLVYKRQRGDEMSEGDGRRAGRGVTVSQLVVASRGA
jgi:hypothetical protein